MHATTPPSCYCPLHSPARCCCPPPPPFLLHLRAAATRRRRSPRRAVLARSSRAAAVLQSHHIIYCRLVLCVGTIILHRRPQCPCTVFRAVEVVSVQWLSVGAGLVQLQLPRGIIVPLHLCRSWCLSRHRRVKVLCRRNKSAFPCRKWRWIATVS